MLIPKTPRLRDRAYLDTARGRPCAVPGCWNPNVIGAHIRIGHGGGTGLKPSDDEVEWLCAVHHDLQERSPGAGWWMDNVGGGPNNLEADEWMEQFFKPARRQAYQEWLRSGRPKYRLKPATSWKFCAVSTARRLRSRPGFSA